MLQPFANLEGWPKRSEEREDAFERARRWIEVMEAAGTDMMLVNPCMCLNRKPSRSVSQIGSSDAGGIISNFDELAADSAALLEPFSLEEGLARSVSSTAYPNSQPTVSSQNRYFYNS